MIDANPWSGLAADEGAVPSHAEWLSRMLERNAGCAYLARFGSPREPEAFRRQVPLCRYEDLAADIPRLAQTSDLLFAGRALAFERTGGSTGGPRLIPYSAAGLVDFQRNVAPWLTRVVRRHDIRGTAYFAISPATRRAESLGGIPVGLPDTAYLGETAARALARATAVPFAVAAIEDVDQWRCATIAHLAAARELELISVWSPTFLLQLLDAIPDPVAAWPRLKLVSCWADGPSRRYADELRRRLPHAAFEPKGLLSTEAVVSVPDETGRPVLAAHGFFEFLRDGAALLEDELDAGARYEVVVTTASGLYRYRTGDHVECLGRNEQGRVVLGFRGRGAAASDLVGEKLTEAFAADCLAGLAGFAMLLPDADCRCYVLVCEREPEPERLREIERRLGTNPQYAYARRLGQLGPLRVLARARARPAFERAMLARGARLGDIKPVALRSEPQWLRLFEETPA